MRSDIYMLKVLEERGKLKANEELYRLTIYMSQGVDRENALYNLAL
jgi:hypothetical protein